MTRNSSATVLCENFLRKERAYNVEQKMKPSWNCVIDRLLERGAELNAVYQELRTKLAPKGIEWFLLMILDVGAVWHPGRLNDARQACGRLVELRSEVSRIASKLAALLRERTALGDYSGFHTDSAHHIVDFVERAGESNGHFSLYLREPLSALRYQFDLKYWPSVADVADAIAADARNADIIPSDAITEAGTSSARPSKADSFRALLGALEEYRLSCPSPIGADFRLSDESWAAVLNVMLDLEPEEMVDGSYIKRLRQRDRNARRD